MVARGFWPASTIFHFLTGKSRISQELKEMNYVPGMVMEGNFSKSLTAPEAREERDPSHIKTRSIFTITEHFMDATPYSATNCTL